MENCSIAVLNEILQKVPFIRNGDRSVRKRVLMEIEASIKEDSSLLSETEYKSLFHSIHIPLLICLGDPVERCREASASIICFVVEYIESFDEFLPPVIATLVSRLSSPDKYETSEEVRLWLMHILLSILKRSGENLFPFMNDIVHILTYTIVDSSPEVKRESCACVCVLAEKTTFKFHMISCSLIKPLLQCVSHQHSKTRCCSIHALGATILHGDNGKVADVVGHLAQRLFDHSPLVRNSVVEIVGLWLLKLPDRYSFFHQLIPLQLSCLSDEVAEVRSAARNLWNEIGKQYLEENKKDFKCQIDFPKPDCEDYPSTELGIERPSLGCRILVQRYLWNILPALLHDIQDWVTETRVKSSKLLYTLLLHAEEKATINLDKFINGIIFAAKDEENETFQMALKTAELLGYFIEPQLWCKIILPSIQDSPTVAYLSILSAILKGCGRKNLGDHSKSICRVLADPYVCRIRKSEEQAYLLLCVETILLLPDEIDTSISYTLFAILTSVAALSFEECIKEKAISFLDVLASAQSLHDSGALYSKHMMPFLKEIVADHEVWTSLSPEVSILSFLIESCESIESMVDFITPVLLKNLQPEKDAVLRSQILTVVAVMLGKLPRTTDISSNFFSLMYDGIFPNLTWHAGETAKSLRTIAIACLWKIISGKVCNKAMMETIGNELLLKMVALVEDESSKTRLLVCKIMEYIFPYLVPIVDEHKIHNLCLDFLKLMDDFSDEIRIQTTKLFKSYFNSYPLGYHWSAYKCHIKEIYKTMLIHMDDNKLEIQLCVLDLLKDAATASPDILLQESEHSKSMFHSSDCCETLIHYIKSLQVS